jgi:dTDP-D-glucose 4,6-dehydratase
MTIFLVSSGARFIGRNFARRAITAMHSVANSDALNLCREP